MWFAGKQGVKKVLDLSKKNKNRIYRIKSDNISQVDEFVIQNGKIAFNKSFNMATNFAKYPAKISNIKRVDDVIFKVFLLDKSWS